MRGMMILGVIAGLAAVPATAGERTGFASIRAGDLPSAERMLVAERRIYPNRPELMLNLDPSAGRPRRRSTATCWRARR